VVGPKRIETSLEYVVVVPPRPRVRRWARPALASAGAKWLRYFCPDGNICYADERCKLALPDNEDIESRLARLARLTAELQAARASRPRRGRGRPTQLAIRKNYCRFEVYLQPEMLVALDELAADMQQRTGTAIWRGDLVRTAIEEYLNRH
jgi:hypothetical protein